MDDFKFGKAVVKMIGGAVAFVLGFKFFNDSIGEISYAAGHDAGFEDGAKLSAGLLIDEGVITEEQLNDIIDKRCNEED